jgi:hypothetical protein
MRSIAKRLEQLEAARKAYVAVMGGRSARELLMERLDRIRSRMTDSEGRLPDLGMSADEVRERILESLARSRESRHESY